MQKAADLHQLRQIKVDIAGKASFEIFGGEVGGFRYEIGRNARRLNRVINVLGH